MRNFKLSWLFKISLIVFSFLILTVKPSQVQAAECKENPCDGVAESDRYQCLKDSINKCDQLLSETRKEKQSLQQAINIINGQITLQQIQIDQTLYTIRSLEKEVAELDERIGGLNISLDQLSSLLVERVGEQYKRSTTNPILLLIKSESLNNFLVDYKYLKLAKQQTLETMQRAEGQRLKYDEQKTLKEQKQLKLIQVENELEQQKANLDQQKQEKANLLAVTQHDESRYQDLLAAAKADLDSIARALSSIATKVGPVKRGEIIASVGNSGCSTGPHLHFEVFKDAKVTDGQVVGTRVDPSSYLTSGELSYPLPNSIITASYGISYVLGVHSGIDFAYPYNQGLTLGRPIYAAADGTAYLTQDSQACYLTGTIGKGMVIDHENGLVTLYWHLP